jgi:PST family polysaccharide transporter
MAEALTEGMNLQLMAMGLLLAGFGVIAPWLVPLVFGSQWLPVLEVYPFIAVSALIGAASALHITVLQVLGRNWKVALFYLSYIIILAGSAFLLVPHLGLVGYGWALLVTILSNILLINWITSYIGKPRYAPAGVWVIAWTLPLFSWQLGPWTWVSVLFPLVWPVTRGQLLYIVSMFLRRTREH